MSLLKYESVQPSAERSDLPAIAQHLFALMLRNVSSEGYVFGDHTVPDRFSAPGCIIASPSYQGDLQAVNQDYVFNWTRDAAIAATELAAAKMPTAPGNGSRALAEYVTFADTCQNSGASNVGRACYTIEGAPREWTDQSDGPALQTSAILQAFPQLDPQAQDLARTVIDANVDYVLNVYQDQTWNLWEERYGYSFFARSAQLRCLRRIADNTYGISTPAAIPSAVTWLEEALQDHWHDGYYVTVLSPPPGQGGTPDTSSPPGYDPNIDIVMASVYGAVPCTDTRLLATAAQLRWQWADSQSPRFYPINGADSVRGLGPLLGRYPDDSYDGDTRDHVLGGHPWALCTCNFAELYYNLAGEVAASRAVPIDPFSSTFFDQIGIDAGTPWRNAVARLRGAGDKMLFAVIYHSDHLELSEQFDATDGYEKSVRNLTWSYASFLSAVRAKTGRGVRG